MTREEKVADILAAWRDRVEKGEFVDPADVLKAHPDLADELRQHLAMHEVLVAKAGVAPALTRVGEYRIVKEIGRGGMGVVYEAEQTTMHRRVALKVLFPSVTSTPQAVQRFQHEARAAGRLKHTNIVAVHQLGQEGGVWYCAMELVDGRPLSDVIRELREARRRPRESRLARRALDVATPASSWAGRETGTRAYYLRVAEMFAEVADALQVAHDHGVVHRDIKPGNLLLDAEGRLKIADFGLARLDDEAAVTKTGDVVGTPLYMSPEQIAGRRSGVDGRSDVYSLGATLYEALALRPPFGGNNPAAIARQVLQQDPSPLRRRGAAIPRDLETIALKALEKDRARRYGTAGAMAQDLRAFALGEAIRARRVGPLGRSWRWARRRKVAVGLGAALVLAATAASLLAWHGRRQQEELAREASRTRELEYFALCAQARQSVGGHGDADAAEIYAQAIALLPDRPEAYLGRMLHGGLPLEERLLDVEEAAAAGAPPRTIHLARARVLRDEADGDADAAAREEAEAARYPAATDLLGQVFEARVAFQQDDYAGTRRRITEVLDRTGPGTPERLLLLADRAAGAMKQGDFAHAIADYHAAVAIYPSLKARCWIGECWHRLGRPQEGDKAIEEVLRDIRAASSPRPWVEVSHACMRWDRWSDSVTAEAVRMFPDSAELLMLRARALQRIGRCDDALSELNRALEIDPSFAKAREERAGVLIKLRRYGDALADADAAISGLPQSHRAHEFRGGALLSLGRSDEAIGSMRRAIELGRTCASAHGELADLLRQQRHLDEALALSRRAVELDPSCAVAHAALGSTLYVLRQLDGALRALDRSLELDPRSPPAHFNRGQVLREMGRAQDALAALDSALALDPHHVSAHVVRGDILFDLERYSDAVREYARAVELDPGDVGVHSNLALSLALCGTGAEALEIVDRALTLPRADANLSDPPFPARAVLLHTRGAVLERLERIEDAAAEYARAVDAGFDAPEGYWNVAICHHRIGKTREALAAFQEYTKRAPKDPNGWGWVGMLNERLGRTREAVAAFEELFRMGCMEPRACNVVAWYRATAADPAERDPGRAVTLARCAVKAAPEQGGAWNTLGAALYAAGDYADSLNALGKSVELRNGGDGCDWAFAAMAHARLGHADKARECYDKAVAWMAEHPTGDEELLRFRKEAEAVLGIK